MSNKVKPLIICFLLGSLTIIDKVYSLFPRIPDHVVPALYNACVEAKKQLATLDQFQFFIFDPVSNKFSFANKVFEDSFVTSVLSNTHNCFDVANSPLGQTLILERELNAARQMRAFVPMYCIARRMLDLFSGGSGLATARDTKGDLSRFLKVIMWNAIDAVAISERQQEAAAALSRWRGVPRTSPSAPYSAEFVQSRVDALHAQLDRETAQVPNLVSGKYSPAAANPNAARVRDEMDFFNSISNPLYYFELLKMIDREVANLWVHRNIPQTASGLDNYITDSFKNWAKDFVNIHKYFSSMTPGRKLDAIHYFLLMSQMHRSMLRTVFDCSDRGESWEIMECGGSDVFYCEALAGGVCSYVVLGHPSALCRYNTGLVLRQTPVDVSHYNVRVDSRFANGDIAASLYRLHSSFPFNDLRSFCRVTAVTEILRAITNAVPQSKSDQSPTKIAQLPQNCNSLGCTLSYKFLCDERIDILANRVCYTDPATQKTILAAASYGENIVYLSANEKVEPAMYLRNCPILGLQSVIVNNVATDPVWMHLSSILCHSLFGPVGYLVSGGNHIRRVYPTGHVEALAQHSLSVLPHQNFITKFIG